MPSIIEELIIVVAVVVIGLGLFVYMIYYFLPTEALSIAEQQANLVSSSSTISVGPLFISNGGSGSAVIEFYNPSMSGSVAILAFVAPSSLEPSVGIIAPTSTPTFTVYLPNGNKATSVEITSPIYQINGKVIYSSPVTVYVVPMNTPVTVNIQGISSNSDILVIWVLYNYGGYWFRVGYSFTGVPSTT
ncbi:MAG: hypothetical protein OWQ54_10185 [Sulfolobaceae archaeon]|nr:hypothetical protein [Sulfolobaceae archaeon]